MGLKALIEKRNDLTSKMNALLKKAEAEKRSLSSEESGQFETYENEVKALNKTINEQEERNMEEKKDKKELTAEQRDYKSVASFIRRDGDVELAKGDNGAVIPSTIANKIIDKIKEISPVYRLASKYNSKGTLTIPKVDTSTDHITVAYATEFSAVDSHANKFISISLTGFLYGARTLVSKSLLNSSDFDLVNWVINRMAEEASAFIEKELIVGTEDYVTGIIGSYDSTNMKKVLASKDEVTADELIDIQELIPDKYQAGACWIMNKELRTAIRKLKDGEGQYLLQRDFSQDGAYVLLGKPVYLTEVLDDLGATNKNVIVYGDISGLAVKENEATEVQVLRERYADVHAVGVVLWGEIDAKIENTQKIAVAVTPAS